MGYIYKITNSINGKMYVGQTGYSLKHRLYQHIRSAYDSNSHSYNAHFQKAIRKYGVSAFLIEELEVCDNALLDERERYWIAFYDSNHIGYNMTFGGCGTPRYDGTEILQAWEGGLSVTAISKKTGMCDRTIVTHLKDLGVTPEEIKRRGYESIKGKVYQYNLDGTFVAEYPTISNVIAKFGSSSPSQALDNPFKSAFGYLWSRRKAERIEPYHDTVRKEVHQYTEDGNYVASYRSTKEAAEAVNGLRSCIANACTGRNKTAYSYIWSYEKADRVQPLKYKINRDYKENKR